MTHGLQKAPGIAGQQHFLLLFAAGYVALHCLYFSVPDSLLRDYVYHYGIVKAGAQLIAWIAPQEAVVAAANRLWSARASLEIVRGCDGAGVVFLLVAAVAASALPWRSRIAGIGGALVLVYLLNQLRIVGLYFIAAYRSTWFVPLHAYFIPLLMVLSSVLYFAAWTAWAQRRSRMANAGA